MRIFILKQRFIPWHFFRLLCVVIVFPVLFIYLLAAKFNPQSKTTPKQNHTTSEIILQPVDMLTYLTEPVSDAEAHSLEVYFHESFKKYSYTCPRMARIGGPKGGAYYTCLAKGLYLNPPCLVYSFGIGDDFEFEDGITKAYGCQVFAFDPTNGMKTHNRSELLQFHNIGIWSHDTDELTLPKNSAAAISLAHYGFHGSLKVRKFRSLLRQFHHENAIIDYLKADIEMSDIFAFYDMVNSGLLKNVKQLAGEWHPMHLGGFKVWAPLLEALFDLGFRMFTYGTGNTSEPVFPGYNPRFDFQMVNINYLEQ